MIVDNEIAEKTEIKLRESGVRFWAKSDPVKKRHELITPITHGPSRKKGFGRNFGRPEFSEKPSQKRKEVSRRKTPLFLPVEMKPSVFKRQFEKGIGADVGIGLIRRVITDAVQKKTDGGSRMNRLENLPRGFVGMEFSDDGSRYSTFFRYFRKSLSVVSTRRPLSRVSGYFSSVAMKA